MSQYPASVSSLLAQTIPWTITLVGTATVIAFAIGTALGIMAAGGAAAGSTGSCRGLMFFQAMPYFFLALILLELLAARAHLWETGGGPHPTSTVHILTPPPRPISPARRLDQP